jgi:tetratricopeptide (TPR) repeat protein
MESSVENDQRVMNIVAIAMRQEPAERPSYLRLACESDRELYREVAEIVSDEERMGEFLLHPMIEFEEFPRPFDPGQVISERFEVIREIGEGGMGVVYEAFDRKRNLRIAIKSAKPGFQRLLSPELESALTVRHPNVCRVNEIHTAQTDHGELDFLSMELLEGETLLARLKRCGKLTGPETLTIARQLCAGLAEAHRSGVLHRDLKSANIILCKDGDGNLRAVITDFGLAGERGEFREVGGTPGYTAPEIWKGERATKASDIYSLGVILYEMVTSRRPFDDDSAENHIANHPAPPSRFAPGLARRWDRTISRCLDPAPDARPADAGSVLAGLEQRHRGATAILAVPVLLLSSLLLPTVRERIWPPPNVRLAVLTASVSTDSTVVAGGWLQDVTERIRHMHAGRRTVAVIPPQEAREMQVETPDQARKILHATHALQTTVRREGDDVITQVSVIDLDTQVHLRDFSGHYTPATIGNLPSALAGEVSLALGLRGSDAAERLSSAATQPYDRALYLLRNGDDHYEEAIRLFREASGLETRSPLPWAGLAEAQIQKYRATKQHSVLVEAQESVRNAESLNPDSARVRLVAGLLHKTEGQYEKALEDYRRVAELEPRSTEALLRTAGVYDELEDPEKAIQTYLEAIQLEPGYYEPYERLGVFYYYRGNYPAAVEQFKKAIERAPGLYDAYTNLGAALNYLGRDEEAEQALLASLKIKETPRALNSLGAIHAYRRQDAEAAKYYERAIALNNRNYVYLLNLGDAYRRSGRIAQAKAAYRKAMNLALAELNENPKVGLTRAYVGYFAARLGDIGRAEQEIGQAIRLSPGDSMVLRKAVLSYVAVGQTDRAIEILRGASAEVVHELARHPDLAEFRRDPRFQEIERKLEGGK